jgi:hypothetical protein
MLWRSPTAKNLLLRCWGCNKNKEKGDKSKMQNGKSRIKRVASAIIAGVMALQTVAPVISYADDTASSVATTDDSDAIANVDPGTPVQVDATASEEPSEAPSSGASQADENSEETETNSDITDEVANEHTDADTADETQTVEEDAPKQDESTSETTDTAPSRTVTVTLNKNGGEFEPEWLETANEDPIAAYLGTETNDIVVEDTGDTIVATVTDRDSIDIPVALSSDESLYFTGWDVSSGSYDADSETLTFEDGVDAYVLSAVYSSVVDDDQTLVENRTEFDEQTKRQAIQERLKSSGISTYVLRPSDSYNQLDLVVEGLAFTSDDGLTQTFTAPYDGDYIITAYGANGGTGKGKYQGYRTPGRGGKAEGTVHLNAGQTIHIYLGEAGGYWSTNRTFGGGGGQIDWDRAWFPDEDNGQTDRYHVFGRGGGATYVTVDAWTMDQAGEAAHDYTDAEKAQNDAAAEVAKNHVILLAGGGGGMGESGGTAGGGGLEGQGPVANRYYAGGFPPYSNAFSYDATVGGTTPTNGRVLTYDERVDAKVYPATQTRAGFGYHYTILGELYDANPANRDPVSLLFDDGQARNYGSFFYGANGITCSGAGGGGWFGGGTDYAFSGGGGSSFVNTSVTIDGKQVEVKDADYEVGGNMKYDSTNSAPYLINGRVLIHMVGTTPKMKTIMMEAQNEDISSSHVDDADVYGQKAYLNKGQDVASTTIAYTAITYYNMGDLMTVNPVWEYSTMLSPTDRDWNDSVAKSIDSRLSVSVANTNLGVPNPGDKYYNADYPGWYAVKSVMTITNPVNTMYSTERLTKYYFRCKGIASYTLSSGTKTMYDKGERGELAIDYNIYINHEGVHVYSDRNIINGTPTSTVDDTIAATAGRSASTWQYPHMALTDVNNINTILIQFSSHGFNTSDSISYDASYADSLGITGSGNQYSYIFKAKSKNSVSTANWEKFLQSITYTTYDAATFTSTGVSGGVTIFWYADENLWENNMFYDSSSGHFYACINTGNSITWGEARNRALSMYNSALDCYGYLAHITSQSEQDYLYTLMDKSTQGWLGATRKVSGNEWDWYWRDGPANETSEPFFRQNADGTYGTLLWGYENWDSKTEPNNSGGVEWCMHYYGSNRGVWNDYIDSNGAVTSFIVEWSKDGLVGNDHSVSDTDVIGTQIVAEQEQKVNNGEVSGTVWAENDYNGLFATDETKLQDITVQLISDNGTVVATAQTNKLGQYDFTGLAPGNYYVKFTSQSFVGYNAVPDGGNSIVQQASKGINDSYAQTPVFALTYNDVLEKSFGIYVPSTVSGFAWDDANQNGIYDNREAKIANVTITLTDADGNSLTDVYGNPIAAVLTDANGNYSFTNVRPRKEMKLTLTSSNTVDISNARVSPIPASGDVKLTNKAEKSIGMLEFNGAPTSATTEKSGSMLTSATIGEIYINSMSGTGITPVNAEYKNFALSANNSIRGYVWVESDYNGILDGWHETQADIDIEEPVLNGVKVTLKNAAGATVATTYTDFAGYYEFLALKPGTYKVEYEETDRTAADKKVLPEEYDYFGFTVSPTATTDKKTQMGNDSTAVIQNNKVAKAVSKTYQIPDTRVVNLSNEKDFYVSTANCALYIPSKVYGYIWQDDNYNGIRETNETENVKTHIYLRRTTKSQFADADEQGTNISGHLLYKSYNVFGELVGNGDLNTAADGYYEYDYLEPGIYYVVFDNTYDYYGQTLINQGNDDTLDSETQPNISLDRSHMYCAWIGDIELPVNTKTEYNVLSKHNDAGFIRLLTDFDLKKIEDLSGIPFENVKFDYEIYEKADDSGKSVFPNGPYTTVPVKPGDTSIKTEHLTTDKNGLIYFTNQDIATYHLTETETLPGYVRNTKTHVVKVMPETAVENNNLVWKTYISVDGVRQADNLYTLKNTSETTNLTVTKKWDDANDQDGIRKNAVITLKGTVTLPDGKTEAVPLQKAYTALFKATDTYLTYTFRSIPAYYKGQTIQYTVVENPMDGYTAIVSNTTGSVDNGYAIAVTNKHVPQFDDFTVVKVWDDSNNVDGIRPDSVTIHMNGSDGSSTEATLSNTKDWKYTFKHIPLFDANGNEITYTITEDAVAGYTYTVTNEGRSFTITNSHVQETLSIPVTKTWEDNGNQDGVRPSAIHVILMGSDGNVYEANLTAAGKWKYEFKDLPRYWMEGVAIDYTLSEETVDNYTYKIEGDADTGFTVTNEHIPAVTNVVINKYWEDAANQDGVRPDSVSVTLSGSDGKTYKATLTKDGGFSETFENLPVFFNNGTKIAYTVTEDAVAGYIGKTATDDTGYVLSITNTHTPETISKTITKTWDDNDNQDGIRPTNVKVELYGTDGTLRTQYLTKDNNWSYSFENLPKYQNEGTIILYTAKEEAVEGYTQKSVTTATGFNFTNTHEPQTVTYGATKVWLDDDNRDGVRPNSITLALNGSDGSKYTKQMTAASNWSDVTFERIPMFNNGKYITYTLSENDVPSYVNSVAVSEDGKFFTVTNTHTPDHAIIKITEVWHDENDQDGIRPKKVTTIIVGSNGNRHEVPLHSSGDWHYTCDDLVKYWKNGQLVDYTVEAVTIDGYTSEVKSLGNNVFEVHNTHIPETISKTVTKTWKDNENQDGIRPASVTVTLTGSNAVSKTATLNEENGWTATFENLPKRDHGNIVTYNVKESDVEGYEASIVKTEDGFQLINEHDSETTLRTATLVWRDENNQDGIRPDTVTYTLHGSDGSEVEKTVSKDDSWVDVIFEDLPVYQNGQKVTYTLTESTVDGYTTDIRDNGHTFTVTNTHIPAVVNVDVTKVWTDGENQDGNRPDSISVILTGNDGNRYTATITAANNWKYTFSKLPKFFNEGTQIEYTLAEDAASGYSNVIEKKDNYTFVLTNKYSPATVDIPVVKKWNDDNDRDGARPESVNIVLNGSDGKLYTGTLSAENGYTYVFQSVPKFHNSGTLISYTVAEEKVTGYTTEVAKDSSGYKFTLTNTKSIETVTKTVSKVWEDSNNQDGLRPSAITVILTGDDGSRYLKSVSAAENWTTTFENLPKNQNHGQNIQYTVSEAFVSGYTDEVTQNGNNYTITNTHMPATTELFVTKTWKDNGNNDGMRPDEITVTAHGSDGRSYAKKLNADNQWSVMFSNLPKYANGKTIDYTLTEEAVPGYTSSITRNGKSFTLINTHVDETKNITITKAWNDENNQDGLRPKSITAVVNGSDGSARFVQLFESQNWTTSLNNLPKYKNSTEVQYTVKENAISGYETEIKQTGDSYTITNTHAPAVVTVSVVKIWDDENNQDGIRPSLIQVTLTGSDGSTHNAAITKNDGWTYQFKDLPQYKNGVKIDYTLQEADSNPYTYEIVKGSDGYSFTITNNYVPAAVNVPVTTIWNDDNNRDGIRAKETVITLQGSNGKVYQHIVTDKDSFATVFEDVPKFFDEGKEVVYTVTQNEVDGYTTNVANTDKYTFQITNTHEPEKLAKTVTKVWDDNNNQDGLRPNTLRIALTGTDGTYIEKNLSAANNWTETFEGLYKYFKEGTPIQYTIDEEAVGGYEKEISEKDNLITITNTHAPEKLDLVVNVVWNDANNQDGYRPDMATIHMSGTDGTQDTKDFTKDSSWSSIVFKDLDRFKDGTKIKYTVTEDEISQYTTSIVANGNVVTVTNTHIPEITLRNISVIWEDNDDQDGIRPDAVNIKLKGNDKLVDSSELNEDVKWKHSFTKLPVRENGNEISYTAEENEIPGYTTTIEKTDTGYVFTNTHIPETVTVTVDKVWDDSENQDGLRPDTIHIKLVSNGIAKDAYLDADSNWHLEFEGLPKYRDHGILNEYSVQEVDVDGYTSTVTTEDGYAFTIKNDHVPAVIDIPITEEWIDDNNRDGLRPSSHTVILTDGINTIEEIVLDKDNGYGTVLKDMPKYKNGVEIDYQIKDFKVDKYTTNIIKGDSVKDFKVTNTHVPEMVTVTVTEGWHDQSDYDKIRPEEIALTLTGSDGNVYEKTVNKETWTAVFSDLPKNSKGEQIIYTLTQEGIKGYSTTITNNQTDTITVINKHEPVKAITVTVTWNDENNKDSIRPDKVTVKLTDGTTVVSTKEVKNDSWKHIFEDIPVFNGSDKVSYTITQDAVNGYTTEIKASDDGNTIEIINTHIPVVPPKEEPKKEEPATPAPVVEVKVEQPAPTVTLIQTTNKPTGISFFESLFAK